MHIPAIKYVYIQNFMFVGVSVIEILEFNRKKKKKTNMAKIVKYRITSITPVLQDVADFFSISLVFSMFPTLALVEVKLNGI